MHGEEEIKYEVFKLYSTKEQFFSPNLPIHNSSKKTNYKSIFPLNVPALQVTQITLGHLVNIDARSLFLLTWTRLEDDRRKWKTITEELCRPTIHYPLMPLLCNGSLAADWLLTPRATFGASSSNSLILSVKLLAKRNGGRTELRGCLLRASRRRPNPPRTHPLRSTWIALRNAICKHYTNASPQRVWPTSSSHWTASYFGI